MSVRPIALLVPLLLLAPLAGCGGETERAEAVIEDFRFVREPNGTQVVRGEVYNPTDRRLRHVQIEVALYEADADVAHPTETMRVQVRDVGPRERVPFRQEVDTGRTLAAARVQGMLLR